MLYVVIVAVRTDRAEQWSLWMRDQHIADVLATGCFGEATMLRDESADTETHTAYRIQYRANSAEELDRYMRDFAAPLRQDHVDLFGDCTVARRELLPILQSTTG